MRPPLDVRFNSVILAICGHLFPTGFDVSDEAPDTFEALKAHYDATGRILVWSGASDDTIYGDPRVNHAFRAWHDWCHLKGGFDFTPSGERAAAELQCEHVMRFWGDTRESRRWCALIRIEVNDQAEHLERFGVFPADQYAFVANRLALMAA